MSIKLAIVFATVLSISVLLGYEVGKTLGVQRIGETPPITGTFPLDVCPEGYDLVKDSETGKLWCEKKEDNVKA